MTSFAIPQGADCPYWSQGDESAFFRWLESIPGVKGVKGQGLELIVDAPIKPNFFLGIARTDCPSHPIQFANAVAGTVRDHHE